MPSISLPVKRKVDGPIAYPVGVPVLARPCGRLRRGHDVRLPSPVPPPAYGGEPRTARGSPEGSGDGGHDDVDGGTLHDCLMRQISGEEVYGGLTGVSKPTCATSQ